MTTRLVGTDLEVMEDVRAQQYVLMLKGRVVVRVPYADVYEARRAHPEQQMEQLLLGLVPLELQRPVLAHD